MHMTPSPPLELASSADLYLVLMKLGAGERQEHRAAHRFDLPITEMKLGDPRINTPFHGSHPSEQALATRAIPRAIDPISPVQATPRARRGRRHCQCGTCRQCVDNSRWERIFNEKFADPMYYRQITIRHNSTLAAAR